VVGLQRGEHVSLNLDIRGLIALSPSDVQGHAVRPYFLGGSLDLCFQQQVAAPLIFACPIVHAGALVRPIDQTTRNPYKEIRPLAAFGVRFGADWRLTQGYGLRSSIDLAYSAAQHDIIVYDGRNGGTSTPVVFMATLGVVSAHTFDDR